MPPDFVDEPPSLTARFDGIDERLVRIERALGTLLTLIQGKPVVTAELEQLIRDLGFRPPSPLLVGAR